MARSCNPVEETSNNNLVLCTPSKKPYFIGPTAPAVKASGSSTCPGGGEGDSGCGLACWENSDTQSNPPPNAGGLTPGSP